VVRYGVVVHLLAVILGLAGAARADVAIPARVDLTIGDWAIYAGQLRDVDNQKIDQKITVRIEATPDGKPLVVWYRDAVWQREYLPTGVVGSGLYALHVGPGSEAHAEPVKCLLQRTEVPCTHVHIVGLRQTLDARLSPKVRAGGLLALEIGDADQLLRLTLTSYGHGATVDWGSDAPDKALAAPAFDGKAFVDGVRWNGSEEPMVPTLGFGAYEARGDLDRAIVHRYVKRELSALTACYARALVDHRELAGTVATSFAIDEAGRVSDVTAAGVDDAVAACMARVLGAIQLPSAKHGTRASVAITCAPRGW
jgi:hypothetical protein